MHPKQFGVLVGMILLMLPLWCIVQSFVEEMGADGVLILVIIVAVLVLSGVIASSNGSR